MPAPVRRGHVLLVEDNALNQRVAVGFLTRLGYHAEVVDNGAAAVEAVTLGSFDAVLMDCQMPGMDGYQATAEIRRREGHARHTPIIAMTAADFEEDRARCLAAGMDDYVTKPVPVAQLEATLSRWMEDGAPVAAPANGQDPDAAAEAEGELLKAFLETVPTDLAGLRAAVALGHATEVDRAAHHLKGAAVTLGLDRMAELCRQLELLGTADELGTVPDVLSKLEEELERWTSH